MTLISLSLNEGAPVLMADILITSKHAEYDLQLPTHLKGTESVLGNDSKAIPVDLRQKLYIINNRLAIAMGGRGDKMFSFYNRLKNLFGQSDFDDTFLGDYITGYDKEEQMELFALVLHFIPDKNAPGFRYYTLGNVKTIDNDVFQKIFAAGSGAHQFLNLAQKGFKRVPFFEIDNEMALYTNLNLIGYWLGVEMSNASTIRNYWGGGYEMILFVDGKFVKLNDYTVARFTGEISPEKEFKPILSNLIFNNYQGEILIIRSFVDGIHKVFAVRPIDNTDEEMMVDARNPIHNVLLVSYSLYNPNSKEHFFPANVIKQHRQEDYPVQVVRIDNGIKITVTDNMHKQIYDSIIKQIKADEQKNNGSSSS